MRRKSHSLDTQHHSYAESVDTIDPIRTRDSHYCAPINPTSLLRFDEEIYDGWDKREPVAGDKVLMI